MAVSSRKNFLLQVSDVSNVFVVLIWILVHLPAVETRRIGGAITCNAGTYEPDEKAAITCNFHKDLSATKTNFNVVHYKDASKSDSGNFVLLCNWKLLEPQLDCKVEDGYTFNYVVSDVLQLDVARVTSQLAGKYVCQVVPDDSSSPQMCELSVKGEFPTTYTVHHTPENNKSLIIAILVILCAFFLTFGGYVFRRKLAKVLYHVRSNSNLRKTTGSIEAGISNKTQTHTLKGRGSENVALLDKKQAQETEGNQHLPNEKTKTEKEIVRDDQSKGNENDTAVGAPPSGIPIAVPSGSHGSVKTATMATEEKATSGDDKVTKDADVAAQKVSDASEANVNSVSSAGPGIGRRIMIFFQGKRYDNGQTNASTANKLHTPVSSS